MHAHTPLAVVAGECVCLRVNAYVPITRMHECMREHMSIAAAATAQVA